jgi:protein required for attachment to host cells
LDLVADEGEARFYDGVSRRSLKAFGRLTNPAAHLHDRDLKSDRPGRVYDRAPSGAGRRGAVGHHGTGGERSPKQHEAELFARRIVDDLVQAEREDQFDGIVVVAGPPFLGMLRAVLLKSPHLKVTAEVPKDLVHQDDDAVREHLPDDVFLPVAGK